MVMVGVTLLLLLALGVPIGIALGASSMLYLVLYTNMDVVAVGQSLFFFINSFTLMAIPFFIYAGFLMEQTGLIRNLFNFAEALLSWLPGGFGVATIFTCVIFAAISGSSAAMAAALSLIAIPEMLKRGYPKWIAAGIVASGGGIGLLIPPSLAFILYGIATETSISRLFLAGVVPGLTLGFMMFIVTIILAWIYKLPTGKFEAKRVWRTFVEALPGLGMPVVVLGGLYGGIFTPTEAGAVAVGYGLLYGLIAEREKFIKGFIPATRSALNLTTMMFFMLGSVGMFQFIAANEYWPQQISRIIIGMDLTATSFLFWFLLLLMFLGMFLDAVALILLTVPVIFSAALSVGVDPIHLGVLVAIAAEASVVTPPVGFNLYAVSGVTKIPITVVLRGVAPYFLTDIALIILVILIPEMATWFPKFIMG